MHKLKIEMEQNEYWYGLAVLEGNNFPLHAASEYEYGIEPNPGDNQAAPLLVSSLGRYVWCENGIFVSAHSGSLLVTSRTSPPLLSDGHKTLRGAFLHAANSYFPADSALPPQEFFIAPQYNTWIELLHEQNQDAIISYAKSILEQGLPAGVLMIDDGWMEYCGSWRFRGRRFSDPALMIATLHEMRFKVLLWTCPFVSPDSVEFRYLQEEKMLVRNADGTTAVRPWWNGYSAVLDMTNPCTVSWYENQLRELVSTYGVDGFKFDAGDACFYRDDDLNFSSCDPNGQTRAWVTFGASFIYNEYRAGFCGAGKAIVQRLADRAHSWDLSGLASVVPNLLAQSILGYSFTCPDMIGGGEVSSFRGRMENLDQELFVRYAQCSALMPMMQFSAAPWRVLGNHCAQLCLDAAKLHEKFADEILRLAQEAAVTGEPIVRSMEYVFPQQGFAEIKDQFMLGNSVLVAPVLQKAVQTRKIVLPNGNWRYVNDQIYRGGVTIEVDTPLEVLPYFVMEA